MTTNATDSKNNNNHGDRLGSRRFLTNALRYPEKTLGDARASISPEYLFSERNGTAFAFTLSRDIDHDGEIDDHGDLHRERLPGALTTTSTPTAIPLSRLSREVREAVDCDPMYGEFLRIRKDLLTSNANYLWHWSIFSSIKIITRYDLNAHPIRAPSG